MSLEREIFKNIKNIKFGMKYDCEDQKLECDFDLVPMDTKDRTWDLNYQNYIRGIKLNSMYPKLMNQFIENSEIHSISINPDVLVANEHKFPIKSLNIYCDGNRFLNISLHKLDIGFVGRLCTKISNKHRESILTKYYDKKIDNIVVFPSKFCSEATFTSELDAKYKNVFTFFNYQSNKTDEQFMVIKDLIIDIIKDYYIQNKKYLDSYIIDDKKMIVGFLNNRHIIIYDKEFINQIADFIESVKNDLIDIKVKRKVLKDERNNNGENGQPM